MSLEERMRATDEVLVALHEEVVAAVKAGKADRTPLEQTRLIAAVALTGRRLYGVLRADDRLKADRVHAQLRANAAAAGVSAAQTRARRALAACPPANENLADAHLEMEMDDDSGRTPERVAALDADLKRRLVDLAGRCEAKAMDRPDVLVGDRAADQAAAARPGPAPASPD